MIKSFDVLNPKEEINGYYLLEASAGTGKTFTIAHLVLRLILEGDKPLSIKKIGTVTFTKAAAKELFDRIYTLIDTTLDLVKSKKSLPIYGENYPQEIFLQRLEIAKIEIEESPISTIHGLCFKILKTHQFQLGITLDTDPEDQSIDLHAYNFVKQFLQEKKLASLISKTQKRLLLSRYKGNLHNLLHSLAKKVLSGSLVESQTSWNELSTKIEDGLKKLPSLPSFDEILDFTKNFKLQKITQEECVTQIHSFVAILKSHENLDLLLEKNLFFHSFDPSHRKQKKTPYNPDVERFFELFEAQIIPLLESGQDPVKIELLLLKSMQPVWIEFLENQKLVSFQSLLEKLNTFLKTSTLSRKINSEFDAFIIDEFQDTDPLQWQIIKSLFVDHSVKAFYMVGDPKQAIYAFRSADIYTYVEVKNQVPFLKIRMLDTCFRSKASLINALNHFFLLSPWIELPFIQQTLTYHPVKSADQEENSVPCFHFYNLKLDQLQTEAAMVDLAISLHYDNSDDVVAILTKDRFQIAELENHLRNKGLSFYCLKSESLENSFTYSLLKDFATFLESDLGTNSIKAFLCSQFFDFHAKQAYHPDFLDICKKWYEPLFNLKNKFCDFGFLCALESLFDMTLSGEITIRHHILSIFGKYACETLMSVAQKLFSKSLESRYRQNISFHLEKLKKSELKIPTFSDQDAKIVLMTSHMSKGLEFDHVIALGIATRHEQSNPILIKRSDQGLYLGSNTHDALSQTALHNLDAEKLRQQYVSLTRAKKSIHIPLIAYQKNALPGFLSPIEYYMAKCAMPNASFENLYTEFSFEKTLLHFQQYLLRKEFQFHESVPVSRSETLPFSKEFFSKKSLLQLVEHEKMLSFTSLKTESVHQSSNEILKGHEFGDYFHFLVEYCIKSGIYKNISSETAKANLLQMIEMSDYKGHYDLIVNYLDFCFEASFGPFRLKEIPLSDLFIEVPFSYKTNNGLMKGFIDLVVVHNQMLYFIDWKTSSLTSDQLSSLDKFMEKSSYDLQIEIYKKALELSGKFFKDLPLTKAFYVFVKQRAFYESSFETAHV